MARDDDVQARLASYFGGQEPPDEEQSEERPASVDAEEKQPTADADASGDEQVKAPDAVSDGEPAEESSEAEVEQRDEERASVLAGEHVDDVESDAETKQGAVKDISQPPKTDQSTEEPAAEAPPKPSAADSDSPLARAMAEAAALVPPPAAADESSSSATEETGAADDLPPAEVGPPEVASDDEPQDADSTKDDAKSEESAHEDSTQGTAPAAPRPPHHDTASTAPTPKAEKPTTRGQDSAVPAETEPPATKAATSPASEEQAVSPAPMWPPKPPTSTEDADSPDTAEPSTAQTEPESSPVADDAADADAPTTQAHVDADEQQASSVAEAAESTTTEEAADASDQPEPDVKAETSDTVGVETESDDSAPAQSGPAAASDTPATPDSTGTPVAKDELEASSTDEETEPTPAAEAEDEAVATPRLASPFTDDEADAATATDESVTPAEEADSSVAQDVSEEQVAEESSAVGDGWVEEPARADQDDQADEIDAEGEDDSAKSGSLLEQLQGMFVSAGTFIGLDIGTSSVKLARFTKLSGTLTLTGFGYRAVPYTVRGQLKERRDFVLQAIRELLDEANIRQASVATVVSGSGLALNALTVPKMSQRDLKGAVRLEFKKIAPFDLEGCVFQYQVGEEIHERGGSKISVMAMAVQPETMNPLIRLLQEAGLRPTRVSVVPYALQDLIQHGVAFEPDEVVAVLDLGARATTANFYRNGELQFSREMLTAGDHITQALVRTITTEQGRVDITIEEAERIKAAWGIPTRADAQTPEGQSEMVSMAQISAMIRPILERLMTESKRSLNYYRQVFKVEKVDRLLLTGGTSRLRNLDQYFRRNFGDMKVERLDPLSVVSWNDTQDGGQEMLEEYAPHMSVAIGLALQQRADLDLLPVEIKIQERLDLIKFALKFAVPVTMAVMLLFVGYLYTQDQVYSHIITRVGRQLESQTAIVSKITEYERMRNAIEQRKALLEKAVGRQPLWSGMLKELSHLAPEGVVLNRLSLQPGSQPVKVSLEGEIYETYTSIDLALSQFMLLLEGSPYIANVELVASDRDVFSSTPKAAFEVVCQLIY